VILAKIFTGTVLTPMNTKKLYFILFTMPLDRYGLEEISGELETTGTALNPTKM
jgi:hypothetical protein